MVAQSSALHYETPSLRVPQVDPCSPIYRPLLRLVINPNLRSQAGRQEVEGSDGERERVSLNTNFLHRNFQVHDDYGGGDDEMMRCFAGSVA